MQLLILAINGFAMPTKLLVPELEKNLDEYGNSQNERLTANIDTFVKDFIWFTTAIANHKLNNPA